jgi:methylthioribulose-1-phosphate dehydratase
MAPTAAAIARAFGEIGRDFHTRGWVLGTSGNFSAVLTRRPLRLIITSSGVSKGALTGKDVLQIDADGRSVGRPGGKPSAEALLHATIVRVRGAGAVLHTHSQAATVLSDLHASEKGLSLNGFEMLKGLEGVRTHDHTEWIPILENSQDIPRLALEVEAALAEFPATHAFLLRRHGLYTWGESLAQARRHIEILEFLLETTARLQAAGARPGERSWHE